MTENHELRDLLGAPVGVGGVRIGVVSALFLDGHGGKLIGLEVSSPDGGRRFLPWVAASVGGRMVEVRSSLVLVDASDHYVRNGATRLVDDTALEGLRATRDGEVREVSAATAAGIDST